MGKWIKSLVGLKAPTAAKGRKWSRLWRSSSSSAAASRAGAGAGSASAAASKPSETASPSADAFSSVVAAVVRAPPRDFRLIRQEWASVRIQAAFRAFLARRALKALRGIVRLQALFRGRLVRREFAVTLKCMHALVRVQERARERRARRSADGRDSQDALAGELNGRADPIKEAEEQWCDSQGSVNEVRSKIHMRHEGAMKRERATAYALSHQPLSSKHSARPRSPASSLRNHESYLEGWMATKPWESRLMEQNLKESHAVNYCEELTFAGSKHSDGSSVRIRRNNVTTRVSAKPPSVLSPSSSDFVCAEGSPSTSSATLTSATSNFASEARSDGGGPNYMSLTKSAKARFTGCNSQRQRSGDTPYYKRVELSSLDSLSNAGSEISVNSRRLHSMSLKGRSMTKSLDKENHN